MPLILELARFAPPRTRFGGGAKRCCQSSRIPPEMALGFRKTPTPPISRSMALQDTSTQFASEDLARRTESLRG